MAFFSLSVALSVAGVKVSDLRQLDLRPSAVKRTYYETSGRVVKYYENIRFVYEIESRVREFKKVATPAETAPGQNKNERTIPVDNLNEAGTQLQPRGEPARAGLHPRSTCSDDDHSQEVCMNCANHPDIARWHIAAPAESRCAPIAPVGPRRDLLRKLSGRAAGRRAAERAVSGCRHVPVSPRPHQSRARILPWQAFLLASFPSAWAPCTPDNMPKD